MTHYHSNKVYLVRSYLNPRVLILSYFKRSVSGSKTQEATLKLAIRLPVEWFQLTIYPIKYTAMLISKILVGGS